MAFLFPSGPSVGQRFTPVGGPTYVWTGTTWDATGAAIDLTPYWQNGSTSLQLDGTTSGTTTLQASAVAGTTTATIPARTANVMLDGPAFSAYTNSGFSPSNNVAFLIPFDTEIFDTNSCYNTGTYRFTPNVAGYYQINSTYSMNTGTASAYIAIIIYKNGSNYLAYQRDMSTANGQYAATSDVIYCNGTTDYISIYGLISAYGVSANVQTGAVTGRFSGCLVRGA